MLTGNMAPTVMAAAMSTGSGTSVEIMGWVTDENPEGLTVTISGVALGIAVTDEYGSFTVTVVVGALGAIYATVTDAEGLTGTDEVTFSDSPPEITMFFVQQQDSDGWLISGAIFDEAPAGLIVTFDGVVPGGLTAVVEADGSFECYFTWNNPTLGIATATVDDVWSQTSDLVGDWVIV